MGYLGLSCKDFTFDRKSACLHYSRSGLFAKMAVILHVLASTPLQSASAVLRLIDWVYFPFSQI